MLLVQRSPLRPVRHPVMLSAYASRIVIHPIDAVTEAEFQRAVIHFAKAAGWNVWHVPDARQQVGGKLVGARLAAGLPDLVICHDRFGFVFAELKRQKGRLRDAQRKSLTALASAARVCGDDVRVHLWRPGDMDAVILPLLRSGEGPSVYGEW